MARRSICSMYYLIIIYIHRWTFCTASLDRREFMEGRNLCSIRSCWLRAVSSLWFHWHRRVVGENCCCCCCLVSLQRSLQNLLKCYWFVEEAARPTSAGQDISFFRPFWSAIERKNLCQNFWMPRFGIQCFGLWWGFLWPANCTGRGEWDNNTVRMVDAKAAQISAVFTKKSRFKMLHIHHHLRLHAEAVS